MKRVDTAAVRVAYRHHEKDFPVLFDALAEIDELRRLLNDACGELEDTGGMFAIGRAAEIRSAMGESS